MGNTISGESNTGSVDAVGGQVHKILEGNSGAVNVPTSTSGGLHRGDRLQGGNQEDNTVVDTVDNRGGTK